MDETSWCSARNPPADLVDDAARESGSGSRACVERRGRVNKPAGLSENQPNGLCGNSIQMPDTRMKQERRSSGQCAFGAFGRPHFRRAKRRVACSQCMEVALRRRRLGRAPACRVTINPSARSTTVRALSMAVCAHERTEVRRVARRALDLDEFEWWRRARRSLRRQAWVEVGFASSFAPLEPTSRSRRRSRRARTARDPVGREPCAQLAARG